MLQECGPALMLPEQDRHGGFRPETDEDGMEWGASAGVDLERTMPELDKARYKAHRLMDELANVLIPAFMVGLGTRGSLARILSPRSLSRELTPPPQ